MKNCAEGTPRFTVSKWTGFGMDTGVDTSSSTCSSQMGRIFQSCAAPKSLRTSSTFQTEKQATTSSFGSITEGGTMVTRAHCREPQVMIGLVPDFAPAKPPGRVQCSLSWAD